MMNNHGGNIYKIEKDYNIKKEEILDFSSNINPLGIPEKLKSFIIRNIDTIKNYPDPDYIDLKEALAEYNNVDEDDILVGNGATELIFLYSRILKPETALIVSPTFIEYQRALQGIDAKIDYFELKEEDDFRLNIDEFNKILGNDYDLLIVCNPNNPTGTFLELKEIEEIVHQAGKYNTRIMIDEAFIEFTDRVFEETSILLEDKNIFVLRSLTKFFAIPGLRLGYAVSFDGMFNRVINNRREPWTINIMADLSARLLLKDKDYIKRTKDIISREKNFMFENLKKIDWLKVYKPSANFILIKILNNLTSPELIESLLRDKILIRDASNFKYLNDKFFRVAIKDRGSNEFLINRLTDLTGNNE